MSDFTYEFPEVQNFLHTLRKYLEITGHLSEAQLLVNTTGEFTTSGQYSHRIWNELDATFMVRVYVDKLNMFTDEVRKIIQIAVDKIFPGDAGYNVFFQISVMLESPEIDEAFGANNAALAKTSIIKHDGLNFRSQTEIRIYNALKKRHVVFFQMQWQFLGRQEQRWISASQTS